MASLRRRRASDSHTVTVTSCSNKKSGRQAALKVPYRRSQLDSSGVVLRLASVGRATAVNSPISLCAATIHASVDLPAATIESTVDLIALPIETAGQAIATRIGCTIGTRVETLVDDIATPVQPLLYPITAPVGTILDSIARILRHRHAAHAEQSSANP
jgi:hypothetical protein